MRHLRASDRRFVASILDLSDGWKDLAAILPCPDGQDGYLLTSSNMRLLEQQKHVPGGSPTQALLDYWGTSGRKRPTIQDLITSLIKCRLYRAADYISVDILGGSAISRDESHDNGNLSTTNLVNQIVRAAHNPTSNNNSTLESVSSIVEPSAPPTPSTTAEEDEICNQITQVLHLCTSLERFSFSAILLGTAHFAETLASEGGHKLGQGAFGSVYRADLNDETHGKRSVAVKLLKPDFAKQFINEVTVMAKFNHENLLAVLGVSSEGPNLCLISEFMPNGSLFSALSLCRKSGVENAIQGLSQEVRVLIAVGAARGLCHLHTFLGGQPLVHRDVKSDNILLDSKLRPKLGDFGLARTGSAGTGLTTSRNLTQNVIGTTVYMAPESFRGDVSVKMDTFSFGIVCFELLTGLKPYDEDREEPDILTHIDEMLETTDEDEGLLVKEQLADPNGQWSSKLAFELFKVARTATERRKTKRPTMVQLLPLIEDLMILNVARDEA